MQLEIDHQQVHAQLIGTFNAYNLLGIYAAALLLGEESHEVLVQISALKTAPGRFEQLAGSQNKMGIVDYAHTPDALENVLKTINDIRTNNEKLISQNKEKEVLIVHLGNILGRTFDEVSSVYNSFSSEQNPHKFFNLIYWLGKLAINELIESKKRTITFSSVLVEEIGHHIYGEIWANDIKKVLKEHNLLQRPIHIISANMHSVMNSIFATQVLKTKFKDKPDFYIYEELSKSGADELRKKVEDVALKNGMISLLDTSGTNIDVQVFDTAKIDFSKTAFPKAKIDKQQPVLIVMDYAFGEQAYETIDELLKAYK